MQITYWIRFPCLQITVDRYVGASIKKNEIYLILDHVQGICTSNMEFLRVKLVKIGCSIRIPSPQVTRNRCIVINMKKKKKLCLILTHFHDILGSFGAKWGSYVTIICHSLAYYFNIILVFFCPGYHIGNYGTPFSYIS